MSRNKIKTHEAIFQPLIEVVVDKSGYTVSEGHEKRYIKLIDDGKDFLIKAKIVAKQIVSPRVRTASISFQYQEEQEPQTFFVVAGLDNTSDMSIFELPLVEEDNSLYAAMLEVAIYELKLPLISSPQPLEIINEITSQYMGIKGYDGHDINMVKKIFPPIELYEIKTTCLLQAKQLNRLVGLCLCKQSDNLVLPFSPDTLDLFEKIFLEGSSAIPYDNLVQCCYSVSWKHAFLEVYRCVERLYPIPVLNELRSKIGLKSNLSLFQLGRQVEEILSWRPLEEASVEKIIDGSLENTKDLLENIKNSDRQMSDKKISKWFYSIRNNIVHFRQTTQPIDNMSDKYFDKLIRATLQIIEHWYKMYETEINGS